MWQLRPFRGSWTIGLQACENLELAGHEDWRMPNVAELVGLMHYGHLGVDSEGATRLAMDPVFDGNPVGQYWSSTTTFRDLTRAVNVGYDYGLGVNGVNGDGKNTWRWVRAVRGGLTVR